MEAAQVSIHRWIKKKDPGESKSWGYFIKITIDLDCLKICSSEISH